MATLKKYESLLQLFNLLKGDTGCSAMKPLGLVSEENVSINIALSDMQY
jgi:hypothetical protein